jgi:hypothetical protein
LARFLATALPIFFDAMIPSLFLPNSLGRKKTVQIRSILLFCPRFITCWN